MKIQFYSKLCIVVFTMCMGVVCNEEYLGIIFTNNSTSKHQNVRLARIEIMQGEPHRIHGQQWKRGSGSRLVRERLTGTSCMISEWTGYQSAACTAVKFAENCFIYYCYRGASSA